MTDKDSNLPDLNDDSNNTLSTEDVMGPNWRDGLDVIEDEWE